MCIQHSIQLHFSDSIIKFILMAICFDPNALVIKSLCTFLFMQYMVCLRSIVRLQTKRHKHTLTFIAHNCSGHVAKNPNENLYCGVKYTPMIAVTSANSQMSNFVSILKITAVVNARKSIARGKKIRTKFLFQWAKQIRCT